METVDINPLAVVIAAVVGVGIGAFWFNSPLLFNKTWLEGIGKTSEQVAAESSPLSIVAAIVGNLIAAVILAAFISWAEADTLANGAFLGFLAGLGFAAIAAGIKDRFEGRPAKLTLINMGHDLVVFTVMGAIIGVWA